MSNPMKISGQKGSALLFSFILLFALTFIAIASVNTSVMGLRMSSSVEEEMNAFQTAAAAIDLALSFTDDTTIFVPTGALDVANVIINCTNGNDCNPAASVTLPGTTFNTVGSSGEETITLSITRSADCMPLPRTTTGSSLVIFKGSSYRISADVDKTDNNRGRSHHRNGVMKRVLACT